MAEGNYVVVGSKKGGCTPGKKKKHEEEHNAGLLKIGEKNHILSETTPGKGCIRGKITLRLAVGFQARQRGQI